MKNYTKRGEFVAFLLCLLLAMGTLLSGCGSPNDPNGGTGDPSSKELSTDLYSFQCQLDGKVYTLPVAFSELAAEGWTIKINMTGETLDPDRHSYSNLMVNGERTAYMAFVNNTVNTLPTEQCDIGAISIDKADAEKGTSLLFPGGVTIGTSESEVIAQYGEPTSRADGDTSTLYTYDAGNYASAILRIDKADNKVSEMRMEHLTAGTASPSPTPAAEPSGTESDGGNGGNGGVPAVVSSYQAPTALGSNWDSWTVNFAGGLYKLPAPVSAFISDGWVAQTDENTMIKAKGTMVGVELRKDNQVLRTSVTNYDTSEQPLKYCFVTIVKYSEYEATLPIQLPGGLSETSSIEDFIATYGEPNSTDESAIQNYYTWGSIFQSLDVTVDKESWRIISIALEYSPKELS